MLPFTVVPVMSAAVVLLIDIVGMRKGCAGGGEGNLLFARAKEEGGCVF
jgi:hypothetical protein